MPETGKDRERGENGEKKGLTTKEKPCQGVTGVMGVQNHTLGRILAVQWTGETKKRVFRNSRGEIQVPWGPNFREKPEAGPGGRCEIKWVRLKRKGRKERGKFLSDASLQKNGDFEVGVGGVGRGRSDWEGNKEREEKN